jgi:8-oxo-dGTP pyrophosphatase MutT (NUDIX family)
MTTDASHQPTAPELIATSSTVVYQNRWMTVREDITLRRDGVAGLYGYVDKPNFALIVPVSDGGFHLVEQYRYPVRGRYWEFPMGSWEDQPDADPEALARGELAEETGLVAGSMTPLGFLYPAYGQTTQGSHVFLATELTMTETSLEETEAGLISRWFSEAEVWELIDAGRFRDATGVAALALLQRHYLGAGRAQSAL